MIARSQFQSLLELLIWCWMLIGFNVTNGQDTHDFSVYGIFDSYLTPIDGRKESEIYSKCFSGIGLTTCIPVLPDDDVELEYYRDYLIELESIQGANYCVECCGDSPNDKDVWDLYCKVDEDTLRSTNVFGFELRMARQRDNGDNEVIRCPLKRTGCEYDDNGEVVGECLANDDYFLVGYTVEFVLNEYDANLRSWRGVESCEITAFEDTVPLTDGEKFHERIVLVHKPSIENTITIENLTSLAFLSLFSVVLVYVVLYFCRKKRCEHCMQKLVCFPRICYKCTFLGVRPLDPVLLAALEEKGAKLQGPEVERFPGSKAAFSCCRGCCFELTCGNCCVPRQKVYPADPPLPSVAEYRKKKAQAIKDAEKARKRKEKERKKAEKLAIKGKLTLKPSTKENLDNSRSEADRKRKAQVAAAAAAVSSKGSLRPQTKAATAAATAAVDNDDSYRPGSSASTDVEAFTALEEELGADSEEEEEKQEVEAEELDAAGDSAEAVDNGFATTTESKDGVNETLSPADEATRKKRLKQLQKNPNLIDLPVEIIRNAVINPETARLKVRQKKLAIASKKKYDPFQNVEFDDSAF